MRTSPATGVHNGTDSPAQTWDDDVAPYRRVTTMFSAICAFIVLTAVVLGTRGRRIGGSPSSSLGPMSEQWLAEQAASRAR